MLFIIIVVVLLFLQRHRFEVRAIEDGVLFAILLLFEAIAAVVVLQWIYSLILLVISCLI